MPLAKAILDMWEGLALWAAGFFIVFGVLARFTPCNPGTSTLKRKDLATDISYFFFMPILNRFGHIFFLVLGMYIIFQKPVTELGDYLEHGYGPLSRLPVWLQSALVFLISDVILYWTHRMFHGPKLWKFHAIHHSSLEIDWLSTYRFHPVNVWGSFTLVDVATVLVGFSPDAVAGIAVLNIIYSALVHANLNWTFGPFKYIFASPVFHRWHHTTQEAGLDKNFAPTFPLLDLAFGTFYMPEGKLPADFGIIGSPPPNGFYGQMLWPFSKIHSKK